MNKFIRNQGYQTLINVKFVLNLAEFWSFTLVVWPSWV